MYRFENYKLGKTNISMKLSERQSMDTCGIHWLNPLLYKCIRKLYPDNIS